MDDQTVPEDEDLFAADDASAKPAEEEPPVPFVGLRNLGNSCFFNSVIQVLLHCPDFENSLNMYAAKAEKFILSENKEPLAEDSVKPNENNVKKCRILHELHKLGENVRKRQIEIVKRGCGNGESGSENAVEPSSLLTSMRAVCPYFEPYAQQDAQECLRCLLDILNESVSLLSNKVESSLFPKNNTIKVLGGGKSNETIGINLVNTGNVIRGGNSGLPILAESKTTAARKRGAKVLFRNPLKRIRESEKENEVPVKKVAPKLLPKVVKNPPVSSSISSSSSVSILTPKVEQKRKASIALTSKRKVKSTLPDVLKGLFTSQTKKYSDQPSEPMDSEVSTTGTLDNTKEPSHEEGTPSFSNLESYFKLEKGKSFVEALFQGELVNEIRCVECEGCGHRVENFMDVSLPVKQDEKPATTLEQLLYDHSADDTVEETKCSVSWGMAEFTSREILDGDNKYYCDTCKRYCDGERRLLLNKLPPIITFHLKRFTSCAGGGDDFYTSVAKINTCYDVPLEMSLDEWCSPSCQRDSKYKLFAIIVHSGTTVCSGHYLAYIKIHCHWSDGNNSEELEKIKSYEGGWLEADDERIRVISEDKLKEIVSPPDSSKEATRTPYLLFYSKVPNFSEA